MILFFSNKEINNKNENKINNLTNYTRFGERNSNQFDNLTSVSDDESLSDKKFAGFRFEFHQSNR